MYLCIILLFISGCSVGYKKVDGKWLYVTWDEGQGNRTYPMNADDATFEVLEQGKYAKDKNKVYYQMDPIPGADPATFVFLKGGDYVKDKNHVYIRNYPVINADPQSFVEIEYPYAKDKKSIYCGTLPMMVKNIEEFEVIQGSKNDFITSDEDYFIQDNKEYSFLKDYPGNTVVTSWGGKAKTKTEYFHGCGTK